MRHVATGYYNFKNVRTFKQLYFKIKITRNSDKQTLMQEFSYPLVIESQKVKLNINKYGSLLSAAAFSMFSNWPGLNGIETSEGLKSQILFLAICSIIVISIIKIILPVV